MHVFKLYSNSYCASSKRQNKDDPSLLGERRSPRLLAADELSRGLDDQTLALVDTRPVDQVHAGTVPGALSIPSLGQAATHIAWAFDPESDEADLVVLADDAQTAAVYGDHFVRVGVEDRRSVV